MVRPDISDKLVHFTGGNNHEEAFGRLCAIIGEEQLRGSGEKIKGEYRCVCFTEAPLRSLRDGLVNPNAYSRYQPFGIIYDKAHVFDQGGRPVIYQPDSEFSILPEELRWRHMRYEPTSTTPVDFTWEREWRVRSDAFPVAPYLAGIVVPSNEWAHRLREIFNERQDFQVFQYANIMDGLLAEQYRERFPWRIYELEK